jgi:hypothetical protein
VGFFYRTVSFDKTDTHFQVVCCHKFYPEYLTPARRDALMELAVYDKSS